MEIPIILGSIIASFFGFLAIMAKRTQHIRCKILSCFTCGFDDTSDENEEKRIDEINKNHKKD